MVELDPKQKKALLAKSHTLKPVVMIASKGLTNNVGLEIDNALTKHELIKIKIAGYDKAEMADLLNEISQDFEALLVAKLGSIGIFYRPNEKDNTPEPSYTRPRGRC